MVIGWSLSHSLSFRLVGRELMHGFGVNKNVYNTVAACEQMPWKAKSITEFVHRTLCGRSDVCVFKDVGEVASGRAGCYAHDTCAVPIEQIAIVVAGFSCKDLSKCSTNYTKHMDMLIKGDGVLELHASGDDRVFASLRCTGLHW